MEAEGGTASSSARFNPESQPLNSRLISIKRKVWKALLFGSRINTLTIEPNAFKNNMSQIIEPLHLENHRKSWSTPDILSATACSRSIIGKYRKIKTHLKKIKTKRWKGSGYDGPIAMSVLSSMKISDQSSRKAWSSTAATCI
jgi:hypothetical protein